MRRMITDPGKILKCTFENVGRATRIYVPIKNVNELPISYDLIITTKTMIIHGFAWYSEINGEVYGGDDFEGFGDNKGRIIISTDLGSLVTPEHPYLELQMVYENDNIQEPPLNEYDRVYVTNVAHLEQGIIEVDL